MEQSLVALLTDFGLKDPFVGIMKGVLLSLAKGGAQFLDLTHEVPPQDLRCGAFYLRAAAPFLPEATLVVAVVDPGVGSARHILWARTRRLSFLAPDNGLLSWAREPFEEIRRVENRELALRSVSGTFHGRDVFAPVAAALLSGTMPEKLGPVVPETEIVRLPSPFFPRQRGEGGQRPDEGKRAVGEVVAVDHFGNCWTSLETAELPAGGRLFFRGRALGPLRRHYAEVGSGRALAVAGSFGVVELAVRDGDFARRFRAKPGDTVRCDG